MIEIRIPEGTHETVPAWDEEKLDIVDQSASDVELDRHTFFEFVARSLVGMQMACAGEEWADYRNMVKVIVYRMYEIMKENGMPIGDDDDVNE